MASNNFVLLSAKRSKKSFIVSERPNEHPSTSSTLQSSDAEREEETQSKQGTIGANDDSSLSSSTESADVEGLLIDESASRSTFEIGDRNNESSFKLAIGELDG